MGFYDFVHTAPAPAAEARGRRVRSDARRSGFSHNWQFLASAVFSKLEGNYDGTFQASTGQLDPNINSAFDYADFLVNAEGRLSNDRNVQLKFLGTYEVSSGPVTGLQFGIGTHWYAGMPLNAYGYSNAYHELGVLPGASRIGRHADRAIGKRTCTSRIRFALAARAGST